MIRVRAAIAAFALVLPGLLPQAAGAQSVEDFYKSHQLRILVAFGAGGGYGLYARTVGEFLGKHIPGHPTVIPQFMSGAGGAKAADYFAHAAPKDGSMIGLMSNGAALGQLLRGPVKYDASKFNYLGRAAAMESALIVWHTAKATTIEQWRKVPIIFGATGKAAQDYFVPVVAGHLLGFKVKTVLGYKGSSSINHAMEKREVDAMSNSWSSVKARLGPWLKSGAIKVLAVNGLKRPAGLPDTPLLIDLAKDPDTRRILEVLASAPAIGRAFSAPPGIPADRLAALRQAFAATMKDPEFLAAAAKRRMDLDYLSGEEVQKIVERTISTPPALIDRIKALM